MELFGRRVRPSSLAAVALVALSPMTSWASHGGPDDGDPHDYVNGQATVLSSVANPDSVGDTVTFDAAQAPSDVVHGTFEYQVAGPASTAAAWKGHVDCLVVFNNIATFGGSIYQGGSGRFAVRTRDNGIRDGTQADAMVLRAGDQTAGDCSDMDFAQPDQLTVLTGEVTVRDHRF